MTARRSLADLRKAFDSKASTENSNSDWKKFFSFWKMPEDTTTIVRFLPDLNEDNPMGFLVENLTHELVINGERKKVPCLSMYGEDCPLCEESRKHYDAGDEVMGKKYYKKRSYIGQVLVIESPFEYDAEPLVKLIDFGPKIFKQIQSAFQSGDLENPPYELKGGYNFRIKKTKSGQYADYGTSSFSPKMSDVGDDILENLELYDLSTYRTKQISRITIEAMLQAEKTGTRVNEDDEDVVVDDQPVQKVAVKTAVASVAAKVATRKEEPEVQAEEPAGGQKASAVLDAIRARAAAKKAAAGE
jgi:hypothetical protein